MIPTKTIQLDFWRHPTDILHLVQGEADGRKVQFKITDNGATADLTGFIAIFAIKKPDGNIVVNSATITEAESGIVETTISSQVVTTAGNAHAELHLIREGQLSKSFRIVTKVAPGVDIDGIEPSVSEFNALQTLIGQAETVISIADTELWPEVVANAQYFSDLAGANRTTETVKGNADEIADVAGEIIDARQGKASVGANITEVKSQLADIEQDKAEKTDVGLLSGLLTTANTSIVNAINELFNNKANKVQPAWITPTLLDGATSTDLRYRKNTIGQLEIKGRVVVQSKNVFMGLPIGYRPSTVKIFTVKNNVPGEMSAGVLYITTAGFCSSGTGAGTYLLDCIVVLD